VVYKRLTTVIDNNALGPSPHMLQKGYLRVSCTTQYRYTIYSSMFDSVMHPRSSSKGRNTRVSRLQLQLQFSCAYMYEHVRNTCMPCKLQYYIYTCVLVLRNYMLYRYAPVNTVTLCNSIQPSLRETTLTSTHCRSSLKTHLIWTTGGPI